MSWKLFMIDKSKNILGVFLKLTSQLLELCFFMTLYLVVTRSLNLLFTSFSSYASFCTSGYKYVHMYHTEMHILAHMLVGVHLGIGIYTYATQMHILDHMRFVVHLGTVMSTHDTKMHTVAHILLSVCLGTCRCTTMILKVLY